MSLAESRINVGFFVFFLKQPFSLYVLVLRLSRLYVSTEFFFKFYYARHNEKNIDDSCRTAHILVQSDALQTGIVPPSNATCNLCTSRISMGYVNEGYFVP